MPAKKALGRGLDALIPRRQARGDAVQELPLTSLRANPQQPRRNFAAAELAELAASIRAHGIIQPLVVRPAAGGYEVVAGERRLLAARQAGLAAAPCIVREVADEMLLPLALVENLQREDLNAVEEARAFQTLSQDFGFSHAAIARAVGKSRTAVTNALRLLELPEAVVAMLAEGLLSAGQARPLIGVTPRARQLALARRIIRQRLSARQAEALAAKRAAPPARRRPTKVRRYLDELGRVLEKRLATKVTISGNGRRGAIKISYFSADDLERLAKAIARGPAATT